MIIDTMISQLNKPHLSFIFLYPISLFAIRAALKKHRSRPLYNTRAFFNS